MKLLILLMSCNKDIYQQEEQACRDTFIQDAYKAEVPYYFYRGLSEEHPEPYTDNAAHVMYLPCPDDLANTSRKTVLALNEALQMDDWDYVLKTNVSTWLDIPKILKAIETWEGGADRNIYGARFIVNETSRNIPFPRGHFMLISRELAKGIVQWAPKLILSENFPKTDDTLICMALLYHVQKILGDNYQKRLMEVPSVISWSENIQDSQEWSDALSIRCKDEVTPENTPDNMRKVSKLKRTKKLERQYYRPMGLVETKYGLLTYEMYGRFTEAIKKATEVRENKNEEPIVNEYGTGPLAEIRKKLREGIGKTPKE